MEDCQIIKAIRESSNLTQLEFANLLNISRSTLAMIENRKRQVPNWLINKIFESRLDIDPGIIQDIFLCSKLMKLNHLQIETQKIALEIDELLNKSKLRGFIDSKTELYKPFSYKELTLGNPKEVILYIDFQNNLAKQRLDKGDWLGIEEAINNLNEVLMHPSFNFKCRMKAFKTLYNLLNITASSNRKICKNIFTIEKQFEIMKCFEEIRISQLNLMKEKSIHNKDLELGDMEYLSPPDMPIFDLELCKRRIIYNSNSHGNDFIDFRVIEEKSFAYITDYWITKLVEGEIIEKSEIMYILDCFFYLFKPEQQKKIASIILDYLFDIIDEDDSSKFIIWNQWLSIKTLKTYFPSFDKNMKIRLEWIKNNYPNEVIQVGAKTLFMEEITNDSIEKICYAWNENIILSQSFDKNSSFVYIWSEYEILNFIQVFLTNSKNILSFKCIKNLVENILYCKWTIPKIYLPKIILTAYSRLNDLDKQYAITYLRDFLNITKEYEYLEEMRKARKYAESIT